MILLDPPLNFPQLQDDDLLHVSSRKGKYGMITTSEKRRLENFIQLRLDRLHSPSGPGVVSGSAVSFAKVSVHGVGREKNNGVLEIDLAAFAIFHLALVKHLIEKLEHVRDAPFRLRRAGRRNRGGAGRFGQTRRLRHNPHSPEENPSALNGMRFLELRHINCDQIALAAVKQIGKRKRGFGFAHAARADQHKDADGFAGIVETRARG